MTVKGTLYAARNTDYGGNMDFFDILTMLGGLALFLYGMDTMGQGLDRKSVV